MTHRMYLSGIGWVGQVPEGNRLRIAYPLEEQDGPEAFLGLPKALIVERAPADEDVPATEEASSKHAAPSGTIPFGWWKAHGSPFLPPTVPPLRFTLPGIVQAVRFIYKGPSARLKVLDEQSEEPLAVRDLSFGQPVYVEASTIRHLDFVTSSGVTLEDLESVDLFQDWGLEWEEIARIDIEASAAAAFDDTQRRMDGATTLTSEEWGELVTLAGEAAASSPASVPEDEPGPWQTFQTAVGIRWEYCVLYGLGYFDGHRSDPPPMDDISMAQALSTVPPTPVAYRVREEEGRVDPSNVIVCPPWPATSLAPPQTPTINDPSVRLLAGGGFEARYRIGWGTHDPRTLGVIIEEERSASPSVPSSPFTETIENRSRRPEDPPATGQLARVVDVPFHDVTVRVRARSIDGWDRLSSVSGWMAPASLGLQHAPVPPPLAWARHNGSQATLHRAVTDPDPEAWQPPIPNWKPDVVVEKAAGRVEICRQTAEPQTVKVSVSPPVFTSDGTYLTSVSTPPGTDLMRFQNGYLVAGGLKFGISALTGNQVFFEVPDEGTGAATVFGGGSATLQQDPLHPSLWTVVADFAAADLPDNLEFSDPLTGSPAETVVVSYATRVRFLGKVGPFSNIVRAFWMPGTPPTPPPFTIDLLGIDFYNRTVIKVKLLKASSGMFSIWWANGWSTDWPAGTTFKDHAVPGEHGDQTPQYGQVLYDVLALPVARKSDRRITLGVQRINAVGGQSEFETVSATLAATEPAGP